MIASGEKLEEYREIKQYWTNRLRWGYGFLEFDTITFSNGYAADRPQIVVECKEICLGRGKQEWGAKSDDLYYVIKLGKIIE